MVSLHAARRIGILALVIAGAPAIAGEFEIQPRMIVETKAVFGRVETRDLVPARSRIGGSLTRLDVSEGDAVSAGQTIALVVDDKLALQLRAAEARIRALTSEAANVQAEFERARALLERGAGTQQRVDQLRTQLEVARSQIAASEAEKSVVLQQSAEGAVLAPVAGRILKAQITRGAVVMPGEQIALVAGGGFFMRLALPERHAGSLKLGSTVALQMENGSANSGRLAKIYPQIENGRVIADVEIAQLGDFFVGARVLVDVPVGERSVLAAPRSAIRTHSGIDFLSVVTPAGPRDIAVILGRDIDLMGEPGVEILTGARAGDRVVTP